MVITGAPASGKTVFLERLKGVPELATFAFFDELARQLLIENPAYRTQRTEFHREIYRRQTRREDQLADQSFVSDRGTVDAFAFHPETLTLVGTTLEREYRRYDLVVQLESAARLGLPYYQTDTVRTETPKDALVIESAIASAWKGHPGYHRVPARPSFDDKWADFIDLTLRELRDQGSKQTGHKSV